MKKRPGIHFRLLFSAVLLISATTLALGYMGVGVINEFIRARFENRITFLTRHLAVNSILGILIDERIMLRRLADSLLKEKDVVRVTILNNNDDVLINVSDAPIEMSDDFSVVEAPVFTKEPREESRPFQLNGMNDDEEAPIGKVRVTYSTTELKDLLFVMKYRFFVFSVGLAVLSAVIYYFISRSLVAPITQLALAARRVATGDLEIRAVPGKLPETRELVLAFNTMLDSIEKNREALDEANKKMVQQKTLAEMGKFSMMIAHEIKNPLSIIKSSLDMLKKEDAVMASKEMMTAYMDDEIRRLNTLIEDFLFFAKPATPNFRKVDLNAMLREIILRFEIQPDAAAIRFKLEISPDGSASTADPDLLTRAFSNIIKNAVESNDFKGEVVIRTHISASRWVAEITDQGRGIPEEYVEKLFEPFFTTRTKGTGLGLAFVSQVIAAHSGDVTAENTDIGGALFRVTLPITQRRCAAIV